MNGISKIIARSSSYTKDQSRLICSGGQGTPFLEPFQKPVVTYSHGSSDAIGILKTGEVMSAREAGKSSTCHQGVYFAEDIGIAKTFSVNVAEKQALEMWKHTQSNDAYTLEEAEAYKIGLSETTLHYGRLIPVILEFGDMELKKQGANFYMKDGSHDIWGEEGTLEALHFQDRADLLDFFVLLDDEVLDNIEKFNVECFIDGEKEECL